MSLRCVLLPAGPDLDIRHRLAAAKSICRCMHAHVEVLFVSPDARQFIASLPDVIAATGVSLEGLEREYRASARKTRAALEDWCVAADVQQGPPADYRLNATYVSFVERVGDIETEVTVAGRLSDLIIVDRPDWTEPLSTRIFDAAVFSSGRPIIVVPPGESQSNLLRKVMIAWNGSLEGSRAVKQSLDLLHDAEEVVIFAASPRPEMGNASEDLATYLRWHGIVAKHVPAPEHMPSVGAALLEAADRAEATMILSGAFTHSRVRQFFLGGVTRHLLDNAKVPLLMAH